MLDSLTQQLVNGLKAIDTDCTDEQIQLSIQFIRLLEKWNKVYNLTAVRHLPDMVDRHLLDSLSISRWIKGRVIDLGTGAGLPVIPLAIHQPDHSFISVESNGKKTRFQQQALLELSIHNVEVRQVRVETLQAQQLFNSTQGESTQLADTVVSRAFSAPEQFLLFAQNLLKTHGQALVMLGRADKLPETLPGSFKLMQMERIELPGSGQRHLAVCEKH
ncbi:MAG: 16S rRNA (guanine(527)-N(7))-methyltransferase RsmG [Gammaproteobacteria bacterium]|nr:16S rRNA (guanine(527)-N(7))-methyltransferase RsmG [Gammaproteobacteria bacterium]